MEQKHHSEAMANGIVKLWKLSMPQFILHTIITRNLVVIAPRLSCYILFYCHFDIRSHLQSALSFALLLSH